MNTSSTLLYGWIFLNILINIKESLQVSYRVIRLLLIELTVESTLAYSIDASMVDCQLACFRLTGWLHALIHS